MRHRRTKLIMSVGALFVLSGLLVAACGSGVDEDEHDAVTRQLAAEEARAQALQQELSAAEQRAQELETELAEILTSFADRLVVLGVEPRDPPEPRPTPTPVPEGEEPPPPPAPPASYYEPMQDFVFVVETLTASGASGDEEVGYWGYTEGCAQTNNFMRGTKMVWRVEIIDPTTGMRVMPEDATVTVLLPHGEERTMRFSQRGGGRVDGAPWMWATGWDIPMDYPVGSLDFQIIVQLEDGRTGIYEPPYIETQILDRITEA